MAPSKDFYWDELGVAWRAIDPDANSIMPKLMTRIRRQAISVFGLVILGIPLSLVGLALGIFVLWSGWSNGIWNFVIRGAGLIVISILLAGASWLRGMGGATPAESLLGMIDLAVAQAEKLMRAARIGLWACVVAAVLGLLGYAVRVHFNGPPAMSPLEPLALLTLLGVGLYLYARRTSDEIARYRYLRTILAQEES